MPKRLELDAETLSMLNEILDSRLAREKRLLAEFKAQTPEQLEKRKDKRDAMAAKRLGIKEAEYKERQERILKERAEHEAHWAKLEAEKPMRKQAWIDGTSNDRGCFDRDDPISIRVKGEVVETSEGANVPLDAAKALVRMIAEGRNVISMTIGHYTVNELTSVELIVGCHNIPLAEVKRVFGGGQ